LSLALNTKKLLAAAGSPTGESTQVEYHFLSWRELYDKRFITADRYSSGTAEWVLYGDRHFYTLSVISRPFYALPQELCLAFDCFTTTKTFGRGASTGPPFDEVAVEFAALLSVLAREALVPLGPRRIGDKPIRFESPYVPPPKGDRAAPKPAAALDGAEFAAVLKGMAAADAATVDAALAAAKLYHAALSLVAFDPSGAYVSLVSVIECLAGHHFAGRRFDFDSLPKFEGFRPLLEKIGRLPEGGAIAEQLKSELIQTEHFLLKKFILFITDHLPDEFWTVADDVYPYNAAMPAMTQDNLAWCLRQIYEARSKYVHAGKPFPVHIELGLGSKVRTEAMMAGMDLLTKERYFPLFARFERIVHLTICEYLRRSFAPEFVQARVADLVEKQRLIEAVGGLAPTVRECLRKLTLWTAQFLGFAVINPLAPNKDWADSPETIDALRQAGLVGRDGEGLEGHAWLKNREVGEAIEEFFFGAEKNPFLGNELLLPKNWDDLAAEGGITETEPAEAET
jgi:hypothetical protein